MKIKDDNLTSNDGTASVNLHAIVVGDMKSPDGSEWKLVVDNAGVVTAVKK